MLKVVRALTEALETAALLMNRAKSRPQGRNADHTPVPTQRHGRDSTSMAGEGAHRAVIGFLSARSLCRYSAARRGRCSGNAYSIPGDYQFYAPILRAA